MHKRKALIYIELLNHGELLEAYDMFAHEHIQMFDNDTLFF